MGDLFEQVKRAIREDRFVLSDHADDRLRERHVPPWQILEGIDDAELISERPQTKPNPTIELEQRLPDGTQVKVVWAYVRFLDLAKLVTIHFFDAHS